MLCLEGILIILLFFGSGLSLVILSVFVYRENQSTLSKIFLFLTVSGAIWAFCHLLELIFPGSSGTLFWGKLKYVGMVLLPVSWILFALQYTGREKYVTRKNTAFLLVVPIIVLFSLWTNGYHHLFYGEVVIKGLGGITYFSSTFGPFFWLNAIYNYFLIFTGLALILYALSNLNRYYWKQGVDSCRNLDSPIGEYFLRFFSLSRIGHYTGPFPSCKHILGLRSE